MLEQLLIFIVALIANFFSALSGGGAGLLQLPILLFLGLPFGIALATHKVASVALGLGATARYLKKSPLERQFALFILISGLPGVIVGAFVILKIPDALAQLALGFLTLSLSIYSFSKPHLGQNSNPKRRDFKGLLLGSFALFFIGILNGSLTSGTGLFVTLWLIYWFGLDYQTAVAYTLILVGIFWNGCGALTLGLLSEIHWQWLPALISASLIGGYLGTHIGILKGNQWIKRSFEIVTFLVACKLIYQYFK